jgi:hypothetical protein
MEHEKVIGEGIGVRRAGRGLPGGGRGGGRHTGAAKRVPFLCKAGRERHGKATRESAWTARARELG